MGPDPGEGAGGVGGEGDADPAVHAGGDRAIAEGAVGPELGGRVLNSL